MADAVGVDLGNGIAVLLLNADPQQIVDHINDPASRSVNWASWQQQEGHPLTDLWCPKECVVAISIGTDPDGWGPVFDDKPFWTRDTPSP